VWVPRETSILLWRRALDRNFVVVPACLPGVRPENLCGGVFRDMQLGEIQTAPAARPRELACALVERFAPLAVAKTPLEVVASKLTELLLGISDSVVEEALTAVSIDLGPWAPGLGSRSTLALALLQCPLRRCLRALEILAEYLDGSKADQVLAMIAPS